VRRLKLTQTEERAEVEPTEMGRSVKDFNL